VPSLFSLFLLVIYEVILQVIKVNIMSVWNKFWERVACFFEKQWTKQSGIKVTKTLKAACWCYRRIK
jgi:hypothetical protein